MCDTLGMIRNNRAYFAKKLKKDRQDMEKTGWEE